MCFFGHVVASISVQRVWYDKQIFRQHKRPTGVYSKCKHIAQICEQKAYNSCPKWLFTWFTRAVHGAVPHVICLLIGLSDWRSGIFNQWWVFLLTWVIPWLITWLFTWIFHFRSGFPGSHFAFFVAYWNSILPMHAALRNKRKNQSGMSMWGRRSAQFPGNWIGKFRLYSLAWWR